MKLTLFVSIGASHYSAVWEHVDVHVRALAVKANRPDHRWYRTADHHLEISNIWFNLRFNNIKYRYIKVFLSVYTNIGYQPPRIPPNT